MLIGASLLIMSIIVIFSLVLGGGFIGGANTIEINNEAIVDGVSNTFIVAQESLFYSIDTGTLIGAITILTITLITAAALTGISVVSTGLNPQSARIIVLASIYGVLWILLSIIAYPLIASIEIFGYLIYVMISIAYVIGAIQQISGGD